MGADLIFIPIHHKHGHWALVSVDTRSTSITLYDSLGGTTEKALEVIEVSLKFHIFSSIFSNDCLLTSLILFSISSAYQKIPGNCHSQV